MFVFDGGAPALKRSTIVNSSFITHFFIADMITMRRPKESERRLVLLPIMLKWPRSFLPLRCVARQ